MLRARAHLIAIEDVIIKNFEHVISSGRNLHATHATTDVQAEQHTLLRRNFCLYFLIEFAACELDEHVDASPFELTDQPAGGLVRSFSLLGPFRHVIHGFLFR